MAAVAGVVLTLLTAIELALPPSNRVLALRATRPGAAAILTAETAAAQQAAPVSRRPVPRDVRAVYLTSWSAATPSRLRDTITLAHTTEVNGVIIDIKDYTGTVVFGTDNPVINAVGASESRLDLTTLVERLHREHLYVVVRIAAFQDQHLVKIRPDLAVRDADGRIWRDRKGLAWVDPASEDVWAYLVEIGREAAQAGVDELNFDYIRFPSDGNLAGLRYPVYDAGRESQRQVIGRFFAYLTGRLRPTGAVLSADLFGLTTVRPDDLGIGQVIEDALLSFDYVSPMVYPSHYARGFMRFANPAAHPYEVVRYSLLEAQRRRAEVVGLLAMMSAGDGRAPAGRVAQIRPWLQAFDLGAPYTPPVIRAQMDAVSAAGLTSGWYLWNPANRYQAATFEQDRPAAASGR